MIGSATTGSDGSLQIESANLLSRMKGLYIIAEASGGQDTDPNDDGIRDTPVPVLGNFRMIIPKEALSR